MADRRDHAVATAQSYRQGNIAGLDDAMTRRLIASTVMTESNGGDLTITNRQGYTGRYQAGAGWLADAGYVDQDELHEAMKGYRSEWAWASQGHMAEFLNDPDNWKNGLSLTQYKRSAELQDEAFKINSDKAYRQAIKNGVLHDDDTPAKIAGFLKARHIAGQSGATAAVTGGRVIRDSNGTSNYDYLHDITRNRDGLDKLMGRAPINSPQESSPTVTANNIFKQGNHGTAVHDLQADLAKLGYTGSSGKPLKGDGDFGVNTRHAVERFQHDHHLKVDGIAGPMTLKALNQAQARNIAPNLVDPKNPDHALYRQALAGVHKLDANLGRSPDQHSDQLAAGLVVAARREGMTKIDTVMLSGDGSRAFAVQGRPDSPLRQIAHVQTAEAVNMPLTQSSAAARSMAPTPAAPVTPMPTHAPQPDLMH